MKDYAIVRAYRLNKAMGWCWFTRKLCRATGILDRMARREGSSGTKYRRGLVELKCETKALMLELISRLVVFSATSFFRPLAT